MGEVESSITSYANIYIHSCRLGLTASQGGFGGEPTILHSCILIFLFNLLREANR